VNLTGECGSLQVLAENLTAKSDLPVEGRHCMMLSLREVCGDSPLGFALWPLRLCWLLGSNQGRGLCGLYAELEEKRNGVRKHLLRSIGWCYVCLEQMSCVYGMVVDWTVRLTSATSRLYWLVCNVHALVKLA
jgi:hypothetical protein